MIRSRPSALLVLAAALVAGEATLRVEPLGPARSDGVLRVAVARPVGPDLAGSGPVRVALELRAGDEAVASAAAELPRLGQLEAGVVLVLIPPPSGPRPLRVVAILTRPGRPGGGAVVETASAAVTSPASALATAGAAAARLRAMGETDPLPWLWAEQAADCAAGGASAARIGEVTALAARISAWCDGRRPALAGAGTWALRDPVDGSVHPWRLHLPPGAGPFPVALLLPETLPGLSKAHWPFPPEAWLAAAAAAGIAVVECYPAGDRAWDGAAARRAPLALAAAQRLVRLDPPCAAVGAHPAAVAAVIGAAATGSDRAGDPAWWRTLPGLPRPPATAPAPRRDLAAVFAAPFAVVVGGGEHAAARRWNRELADALRAAYAAHAHAIPPELPDDAEPAAYAGRNLVFIGNPRSNRLLARLAPALPFAWDHRSVHGPGLDTLRSARPSLACRIDLPGGRIGVVLDGSPPPWGDGLPLAGLPTPWSAAR